MSKSNALENDLLKLLFNGTAIANVARDAASPITNLYVSLHTANPGDAGNQTTSEAAYTGYARVAVARTSGGWVVSGNTVNPAADIVFPVGSGGSGNASYWGIGTDISGAGKLLYSGTLLPVQPMGAGITPRISDASTITED